MKAYFDAHKDKFKTPETFTARHILIGTQAQGDKKALTDAEAKAKADKVLAEIKAGKTLRGRRQGILRRSGQQGQGRPIRGHRLRQVRARVRPGGAHPARRARWASR